MYQEVLEINQDKERTEIDKRWNMNKMIINKQKLIQIFVRWIIHLLKLEEREKKSIHTVCKKREREA